MTGAAALGAVITLAAGSQPGFLLSAFLIAGTAAAALAVQPRAVYQIIPAPALAYVATATLAGLISDRATGTSRTALAITAAQSIASGFLAMTAATVLAIVITAARWPRNTRGPRSPGYRPPTAPAGSLRRQGGESLPARRGLEREADYPASEAIRRRRRGRRSF